MNKSNINTSSNENASSKDKNINIVIIKNVNDYYEANSNDYLNLIKDNNILKPDYVNLNINIIIIQNVISSSKNTELKNKVENIPIKEEDLVLETGNNNINLMVIKNMIPLQDIKIS